MLEMDQLNLNNKMQVNVLVQQVDDELSAVEDELYDRVRRNEGIDSLSFPQQSYENLYQRLSADVSLNSWQELLSHIITLKEDLLRKTLSLVDMMIRNYKNNFIKHFDEKLCFDGAEFDQIHEESLMIARDTKGGDSLSRGKMNKLFESLIEKQRKLFLTSNYSICKREKEIAEEAHDYTVDKYNLLMDNKISSTTLTKQELQTLHQRLSSEISVLFVKGLEYPHTNPWRFAQAKLNDSLKSLEKTYIQKNQNHLTKVEKYRKEAIEAVRQCYKNEMTKNLPTTKLSVQEFNNLSESCRKTANRRMQENFGDKIHKNISKLWTGDLHKAMEEVKSKFFKENENKSGNKPRYQQESQSHQSEIVRYNPIVNHSTQVELFGIGLYIDVQNVYVGVFINPEIQFENNVVRYDHSFAINYDGDVLIGEEAVRESARMRKEKIKTWTIFSLLCDHPKHGYWIVNICGKNMQLRQEELLSLYFQKIRMNTELIITQRVSSCFVAVSGLLSSGAKQILKTSLKLAGFTNNNLISCTTAMAISYSLKFRDGDLAQRMQSNLFVYTCQNLVEVTAVDVSSREVNVKNIYGDIDIFSHLSAVTGRIEGVFRGTDWKLQKKLENIFRDLCTSREYQRLIFCDASRTDRNDRLQMILNIGGSIHPRACLTNFKFIEDIIEIAAMLDANRRGMRNALSIPIYSFVHPYEISVKIKGQTYDFSKFNQRTELTKSVQLCGDTEIEIHEKGISSNDHWIIRTYDLVSRGNFVRRLELFLGKEGNLNVNVSPGGNLLKSNLRSLTSAGQNDISDTVRPMIEERERYFRVQFPSLNPPVNPSCSYISQPNTHVAALVNSVKSIAPPPIKDSDSTIEELKTGLVSLIEKIESDLGVSKSTSTAVRENIKSKIEKCQRLMKSSDVKVKQLEFEKNNLERASSLIKQ